MAHAMPEKDTTAGRQGSIKVSTQFTQKTAFTPTEKETSNESHRPSTMPNKLIKSEGDHMSGISQMTHWLGLTI